MKKELLDVIGKREHKSSLQRIALWRTGYEQALIDVDASYRSTIKELEDNNPYPADVFRPPTAEEFAAINKLLRDAGFVPDAIHGSNMRRAREYILYQLKKSLLGVV